MIASKALTWDDYVIIGTVAALVYPEATLAASERTTGKILGLKTVIVFEVAGIVLLSFFIEARRHYNPHLSWWFPIVPLAIFLVRKTASSLADDIFGK